MPDIKQSPLTRLKRARKRGSFDRDTINAIVDASPLCHVGHLVDGQPVVTPTCHWRHGDNIYWHGSRLSRMLDASQKAPVCLTVTHLDGLVMARSGFHHSANYRSAMIFGEAREVAREDKTSVLRDFIEGLFPGRWDELRAPTRKEMNATTVLWMPIEEASAKIRTGPPIDDDGDLDDPVWAGVVPLHTVAGEPERAPDIKKGVRLPGYLKSFRLGGSDA